MPVGYKVEGSGRKVGSLNKVTAEMKEQLQTLAQMQIDVMMQPDCDYTALRSSNEVLRTILPYIIPKCATMIATENDNPVQIQIHGNI